MLYGHNYIVQIQYQSLQEGPQGRVNQDTRLDNRIIDLRVSKSFCIDFRFFQCRHISCYKELHDFTFLCGIRFED